VATIGAVVFREQVSGRVAEAESNIRLDVIAFTVYSSIYFVISDVLEFPSFQCWQRVQFWIGPTDIHEYPDHHHRNKVMWPPLSSPQGCDRLNTHKFNP
jgi:hypothetical protein